MDLSDYCRDLETYLCRKNDGHLVRIVGPSFDVVAKWATDGVPLKVAMAGIDRYFERYYRKGPRRRPVKIDFCEADVLDVFDEWRRATGLSAATEAGPTTSTDGGAALRRKGPSLPEHLERVLIRLSSLRATGSLGDAADTLVDAVALELDAARGRSAGVRGEERRATIERLGRLDAELAALIARTIDPEVAAAVRREVLADLASFRSTMSPDAFEQSVELAVAKALRARLGLPVIAFT
jgi:hypothetical protein